MFPRGDFMGTMGRVENVLRTRRMEVGLGSYFFSIASFPSEIVPLDVCLSDFGNFETPELDTIGNEGLGSGMLCKTGTRS